MYAWHDIDGRQVYRRVVEPVRARSQLPAPGVISDTMDATEHVDGRFYTSKSKFRSITREHGLVEVGNDPARFRKPSRPKPDRKSRREAIQKADYLVRNGLKP